MSFVAASGKYIAVAKNLQIDMYDSTNHKIVEIPTDVNPQKDDHLTDIAISTDSKYFATITSISKRLILYELPTSTIRNAFLLRRSASKIRFTVNNSQILVADKSGDVILYAVNEDSAGTKLLGHLSLLLDILQTTDEKFIITSDRDEKIKVSCFPNTYNIKTYCLGHKEFVNHIELLPHNDKFLISSSGDGVVKIWDYAEGNACNSICIYSNVNDPQLKDNFTKKMDEEGIEVETLPIVHLAVTKVNDQSSLLAICVHTYNSILIYSVTNCPSNKLSYKLETKLDLDIFPSEIQFYNSILFVYNESDCSITYYNFTSANGAINFAISKVEKFFENISNKQSKENHFESIKLLYKRKFDNVQEYQERKKQRLEKTNKMC